MEEVWPGDADDSHDPSMGRLAMGGMAAVAAQQVLGGGLDFGGFGMGTSKKDKKERKLSLSPTRIRAAMGAAFAGAGLQSMGGAFGIRGGVSKFHAGGNASAHADGHTDGYHCCSPGGYGDADPRELCSQVLESVVAKVQGRTADPTLPIEALTRRVPEEDAVNQLFQLATLDQDPYRRELQAGLYQAGAIKALAAALSSDGTAQAKQRAALALCSISRNSPTNRRSAKLAVDKAILNCLCSSSIDIACSVFVIDVLLEGEVLQTKSLLDMLLSLSADNPTDLGIQRRTSVVLQSLVQSGSIDSSALRKRDAPLLSKEWTEVLTSFQESEIEGERLQTRFHADVQVMFHEEVVRQFEYEAAERCLDLHRKDMPGMRRLREVIRCFVERLEDYRNRLESRDVAWDADAQQLVPLGNELRERLSEEVHRRMEPGLISALQLAAREPRLRRNSKPLKHRRERLFSECSAILHLKTEVTQEHQEQAAKLRPEVLLFQAIEYLEAHLSETTGTQVRTMIAMFNAVETKAPHDAIDHLRKRLQPICACHNLKLRERSAE